LSDEGDDLYGDNDDIGSRSSRPRTSDGRFFRRVTSSNTATLSHVRPVSSTSAGILLQVAPEAAQAPVFPAPGVQVCNGFDSKGLCYATRALTANDFVSKRTSGRRRFQSCPFCRAYRAEYASRDRSGSGSRPPPVPAGLRRRCDLCDPKNDDERDPVYKGLPCNTVRPCGITCLISAASMLTWRASPSSSAPRPSVGRTTCRSRRLACPSSGTHSLTWSRETRRWWNPRDRPACASASAPARRCPAAPAAAAKRRRPSDRCRLRSYRLLGAFRRRRTGHLLPPLSARPRPPDIAPCRFTPLRRFGLCRRIRTSTRTPSRMRASRRSSHSCPPPTRPRNAGQPPCRIRRPITTRSLRRSASCTRLRARRCRSCRGRSNVRARSRRRPQASRRTRAMLLGPSHGSVDGSAGSLGQVPDRREEGMHVMALS